MKQIRNLFLGFLVFALSIVPTFAAFSDSSSYEWNASISYLEQKGIVQGYEDGTFKPLNKINRAEFTKIIIAGLFKDEVAKFTPQDSCFTDIVWDVWYASYICIAKEKGIVSGNPDGTFRPANNINQAEALKILLIAFQKEVKEVNGEWYQKYLDAAEQIGMKYFAHNRAAGYEITRGEMSYFTAWLMSARDGKPVQQIEKFLDIPEEFSYQVSGTTHTIKMSAVGLHMNVMSGNSSIRHKDLSPPDNCNPEKNCVAESQAESFSSFINRSHKKLVINGAFFDAYSLPLNGVNFHQIASDIIINGVMKSMYGYEEAFGNGGMLAQMKDGSFDLLFPIRRWVDYSYLYNIDNAISNYPLVLEEGNVLTKEQIGVLTENDKKFWVSGRRGGLGISIDHQMIYYVSTVGTVGDLGQRLKEAGADYGFSLDAGGSNGMYYNGKTIFTPGRNLTTVVEFY